MKPIFTENTHRNIYLFAIITLVVGMPLSKFLMSISQLLLAFNWLLEGNVKNKFIAFYKNKTALVLSSLLLMHFIGLAYTDDYNYAFKDMRIKLPLFILPLIISTSKPLSEKWYTIILKLFVVAIIIGTVISMLILLDIYHRPMNDIRDVSIFISHIRFALLICVAVFVCAYFFMQTEQAKHKVLWGTIALWFVVFLIIIESLTGLFALFMGSTALFFMFVFKSKNTVLKISSLALFFLILGSVAYYLKTIADENKPKEAVNFKALETHTALGNLYEHDTLSEITENGHLLWANYAIEELREAWNKRATIHIDSTDDNGNTVYFTLFRFLTSKGLKKDAAGVNQLTNEEVKAIEQGITNVNYQNISSLRGRIYETLWEIDVYKKTGQASGHSLTQRFEYWKAAIAIIKENILFGVGTGDLPHAFENQYIKSNSSLSEKARLRSHNQYLSIAVGFGVIGLCWFIYTLIFPWFKNTQKDNIIYLGFFIVALVSFFTEDTLETQAGVTFYAFINSYLLFAREKKQSNV